MCSPRGRGREPIFYAALLIRLISISKIDLESIIQFNFCHIIYCEFKKYGVPTDQTLLLVMRLSGHWVIPSPKAKHYWALLFFCLFSRLFARPLVCMSHYLLRESDLSLEPHGFTILAL